MKRTPSTWSFVYERTDTLIGFIIFILGILVTFIWTILKLTGVINTPLWQEILPYWAALLAVAGGIFGMGTSHGEIRRDLQILKQQNKLIFHKLDGHEERFNKIDGELQIIRDTVKDHRHEHLLHMAKYHSVKR